MLQLLQLQLKNALSSRKSEIQILLSVAVVEDFSVTLDSCIFCNRHCFQLFPFWKTLLLHVNYTNRLALYW